MRTLLNSFLLFFTLTKIDAIPEKLCANGVFKCTSSTSLRICFRDKLVTSEFSCPPSTFCNEKSSTICTSIPAALPAIYYPEDLDVPCNESEIFEVKNSGCTTYLNCSNNIQEELTCDEVSLFNPDKKTCDVDYICLDAVDYSQSYEPFVCTKIGNFPLPNSDCLKYIYCKQIYTGFKAIQKTCPSNTLFDPTLGKCIEGYVCKDKSLTTTPVEELITPEDILKCTSTGKIPLPNTNCTMYRLCSKTSNGFVYKDYSCPKGYYFDPNKKTCSNNYKCWPEITSTTDLPITTSTDNKDITTPLNSTDFPISNSTYDQDTTTSSNLNTNPTIESSSTPITTVSVDTTTNFTNDQDTTSSIPNITNDVSTYPTTTLISTVSSDTTPNPTDNQDTTSSNPITTDYISTTDILSSSNAPVTTTSSIPNSTDNISTNPTETPNTTISDITTSEDQDTTFSNPITTEHISTTYIPNSTTTPITTVSNEQNTTSSNPNSTDNISTNPTEIPNTTISDITTSDDQDTTFSNPMTTEHISTTYIPNSTTTPITTVSNDQNTASSNPNSTDNIPTNPTEIPNSTITFSTSISDEITLDDQNTTSSNPITTDISNSSTTSITTVSNDQDTTFSNPNITDNIPTNPTEIPNTTIILSTSYFSNDTTLNDQDTTSSNPITTEDISRTKIPNSTTPITTVFNDQDITSSNPKSTETISTIPTEIPNTTINLSTSISDDTTSSNPNTDITDDTSPNISDSPTTIENEITTPIIDCRNQGRLPVLNTKCRMYYQCTLTTSGYKYKTYECSSGTLYDPYRKICTNLYICPEIIPTTLSVELSTTPITTTPFITTTEIQSPIVPLCTEQGKFPISNTKCKNYLSCILTTSGFKSTEYSCSGDLLFDPNLKKCSSTYKCREEISTYPLRPESIECTTSGKFIIPNTGCIQYKLCVQTSTGIQYKIYSCPIDTLFDSETNRCSKNYICPETITTTPENYEQPECQKNGKFSIDNTGCSQYILCSLTTTGFKSKIYSCPNDSYFNPDSGRCQKDYICPETSQSGECRDVLPDNQICTKQGKFPIYGTNCNQYILCSQTTSGFRSKVYNCPTGSYFDPAKNKCTVLYECTEKCGKPKLKLYNCTTIGLFKDTTDTTCQYFINCKATDGVVIGVREKCHRDQYFDPVVQKCSSYYMCKEQKFARLIEKTPKFLVKGQCTTVGRYAIPWTNCKQYMLCQDNGGGTLKGTPFNCPTTSVFNQVIQQCTATYICPDSVCYFDGRVPNPNSNDCTSYIQCQDIYDDDSLILLGTSGIITACPAGQRFNPRYQCCSTTYICRT